MPSETPLMVRTFHNRGIPPTKGLAALQSLEPLRIRRHRPTLLTISKLFQHPPLPIRGSHLAISKKCFTCTPPPSLPMSKHYFQTKKLP